MTKEELREIYLKEAKRYEEVRINSRSEKWDDLCYQLGMIHGISRVLVLSGRFERKEIDQLNEAAKNEIFKMKVTTPSKQSN